MSISFVRETETFDPVENLHREAFYIDHLTLPAARVWRNTECVVLGKFLRAQDEVHVERARAVGIPVLKRISGGGAVFHDLGNINYSIYLPAGMLSGWSIDESLKVLSYPVLLALESLGLPWEWVPPNNIYVEGRKVSGSAQARKKCGLLHHGTLLVSCDLARMRSLLKDGGRSKVAGVVNLNELLSEVDTETVEKLLADLLISGWPAELC
ncbi:MAG: lipoate--protein ligase family protein [Actinobacteria bacterium]|nr:lipoate--protein ligase family protein [Actinomycetota bacterium]